MTENDQTRTTCPTLEKEQQASAAAAAGGAPAKPDATQTLKPSATTRKPADDKVTIGSTPRAPACPTPLRCFALTQHVSRALGVKSQPAEPRKPKYQVRPGVSLESKFLKEQDAKTRAEEAALAEEVSATGRWRTTCVGQW